MNIYEIINVLEVIEEKIEEQEHLIIEGTIYESKEELLEDINDFILELEEGNEEAIEYIDIHFLKGATFDLIAQHNNWPEDLAIWVKSYEQAKQ